MSETDRLVFAIVARLLEYPDEELMAEIPALREDIAQGLADPETQLRKQNLMEFLDLLECGKPRENRERYVATFDHDPAGSLYMAWHRYGNDRGQGKAMAALNGLYREAGLEPVKGALPDYLPRILEFMSFAPDWAVGVMLDGFGPELGALIKHLEEERSPYAQLLKTAFRPLMDRMPGRFAPRRTPDPTIRPMARPEPETLD